MRARSESTLTRRRMIQVSAGAAALGALGLPSVSLAQPDPAPRRRSRALRIAHLTDTHIQPERKAAEGVAACLAHVQSEHAPDLILTGGDLIMDGFASDESRTRLQWELWRKVLKDGCSAPVRHCLGNHDIWGWHKGKSRTTGDEPRWGKKWAVEQLGLERAYYTFKQGGWRFFVLDSVHPDPLDPDGYIGAFDDEQLDWLSRELAADRATPTLVITHIPILTATVVLDDPEKETNTRPVSSGLLMADGRRTRSLFAKHPNVKVCVAGHMHRIDRVDFLGVSYLCNGAVSGNWWKGAHHECREGYAVIDLFDDGSFENRYVTYGWKAET